MVKCIDNRHTNTGSYNLTVGNQYRIEAYNSCQDTVVVLDDDGKVLKLSSPHFIKI